MKVYTFFLLVCFVLPGFAYADKAEIMHYPSGCDYFIADGDNGYYLLEWYGGYDPDKGDRIVGDISTYGMKDVYYPDNDREGRIYVDDYMLSKDSVIEKYYEKCD